MRDGKGRWRPTPCLPPHVKHSPLLGDFLGLVVAEQYRLFAKRRRTSCSTNYLDGCRERDPDMPEWSEWTRKRLRSSVFQTLAQAGYLENTRDPEAANRSTLPNRFFASATTRGNLRPSLSPGGPVTDPFTST